VGDRPIGEGQELVLGREVGGDHALSAAHAPDERGKLVIALRADHEIDHACPLENLLSFGLGHAAGNGDHGVQTACISPPLHRAHPAKLGINLLGGLLADMTGVENDEIGIGRIVGRRIAMVGQRLRHALGVVGVHLAAEGLDVQFLGRFRHRLLVRHAGASRQELGQPRPPSRRFIHVVDLSMSTYP
jgi:hypothetical protein